MDGETEKTSVMNQRGVQLGLIVFVLFVTFILGVQGLNADVIWYDELTSIGHAGGLTGPFSPVDVLQSIAERSPKHTPLFFETLSIWGNTLGWHQAILRMLPLFFGVLTIAWIYRIGKDVGGWRVGLWSAVFMGLNVFWVEYYHEIRMYTLQIALLMMMVWHYLYLSNPQHKARWYHWVGLIFAAIASLYTQPFSFFVHVAIGLYHVLFAQKKRRWFLVTFAFLLVGLLYLPWFGVTYIGLTTKFDTSGDPMAFQTAVQVFLRLFSNGTILLLIVPLAFAIFQLHDKQFRQRTKPIWILAIFIVLLLLVVNETIGLIPLRRARYFFVSWGMWSLIMGIGLAQIRYQWVAVGFAAVFLVSGFALRDADDYVEYQGTISAVDSYPPMQDYVDRLQDKIQPHDFVVGFTDANFVNHRGKHGKSTSDYYMDVQLGVGGTFIPTHFNEDKLKVDIPEKLAHHPYILMTFNPQNMPNRFDVIMNIIQPDYVACDIVIDEPDLYVQRFVDKTLGCDHQYEPIVYDNGVTIVDKFIEYDASSDTVHVVTGWEVADERLLDEYNVSIQIVTPDWQNVGQTDRHLYDDILKWYRADLAVDDLPAGDYRVMAILYDRETGEKVNGTDLTTGETGTILPLGVFSKDTSQQQFKNWHTPMAVASGASRTTTMSLSELYNMRDNLAFQEEMQYLASAVDHEGCDAQHILNVDLTSIEDYTASIEAEKQAFIDDNFGILPEPIDTLQINFQETVLENDDYRLDYMVFESRLPYVHVYTYLIVPKSPAPAEGYPAVVVLHANSDEIEPAVGIADRRDRTNQVALAYVKQGAIVLVPHMVVDMDIRAHIFSAYDIQEHSPFLPSLQRLMSVIDWLDLQSDFPIRRIGVHGLSYGGIVALWGGIADDRIDTIGLSHSIRDYSYWLYGDSEDTTLYYNPVIIWIDGCRWDSDKLLRLATPDNIYIESSQYDRTLTLRPDFMDSYYESYSTEPLDMSSITDITDAIEKIYADLGISERFYAGLYDGEHEVDANTAVPWILARLTRDTD